MYFDLIAAEKDFCNFLSENYEHHYYGHVTFDNGICRLPCPFSSSSNNKDFSYALYSSAIPAGWCQCWHCGIKDNWCFKKKHEVSQETWNNHRKNLLKIRYEQTNYHIAQEKEGAKKARTEFSLATRDGVKNHPYIINKKMEMLGEIRQHRGVLKIPLTDVNRKLRNLESIYFNSNTNKFEKRPIAGARSKGVFHLFGEQNPKTIQLATGIATASTIYEITNITTACCRSDSNIIHTARAFRQKYPKIEICIMADDDRFNLIKKQRAAEAEGKKIQLINSGIEYATKAAKTVDAKIILPDFSILGSDEELIMLPDSPSDFNDIIVHLMNRDQHE